MFWAPAPGFRLQAEKVSFESFYKSAAPTDTPIAAAAVAPITPVTPDTPASLPSYASNVPTAAATAAAMAATTAAPAPRAEAGKRHAALLLIGAARALVWPAVCENIKRRLVDGLARPVPGEDWKVDVFLFMALEEEDAKWGRMAHDYGSEQLKACSKLLRPTYVQFMPPSYQPVKRNCSKGHEPAWDSKDVKKDVRGRIYSQCYRIQAAFDYLLDVFQPQAGVKYDAIIRARPDIIYLNLGHASFRADAQVLRKADIFLREHPTSSKAEPRKDVPPLSNFNLSRPTATATAMADHFHVIHPGCRGPLDRTCLRCKGQSFDLLCREADFQLYRESGIQSVVAREMPMSRAKELKVTPPRRKSKEYGFLFLECERLDRRLGCCIFFEGMFVSCTHPAES